MIRIYCDWNNRIDDERFDLGCHGSLDDIARHADTIKVGLRVLFYQTDELEAEGVLAFDEEKKRWIAVPDMSTMRYIGRSALFGKMPNKSLEPTPTAVTPRADEGKSK